MESVSQHPIIRPAAVAGMFYPDDRGDLLEEVDTLLGAAPRSDIEPASIKALAVPHAGYIYSGPTAAAGYALLETRREQITRVVLLGPTHRVAVHGLALPDADLFETPFGSIPIDVELAMHIETLPQVLGSRAAHAAEHSLEVQLPFLQRVLGEFSLLPLAVGQAHPEEVAQVLDALWGGPETLIVISTDLSHFHGYHEARQIDASTVADVLALRARIDHEHACGATPLNGMLVCARRRGLEARLIDARNSGDTAGDKSRVVGYASFAFCEATRHG